MNWLSDFCARNPEYRRLHVARRDAASIHFELEPNVYQAFFTSAPMHARTSRGWIPLTDWVRVVRMAKRMCAGSPRAALQLAAALPWATVLPTIQPDAAAGLDTYIDTNNANSNYATSATIYAGNIGRALRILIKFDLSTLPNNALLSSNLFSLYCTNSYGAQTTNISVYRQKRAWTEAAGTWNKYDGVNAWATAGGFGLADCEQTAIGVLAFADPVAMGAFKDWTLTPTTKSALDLGNGWLIKSEDETRNTGEAFVSSDGLNAAQRPKLAITYTLPVVGGIFNPPVSAPFRGLFG